MGEKAQPLIKSNGGLVLLADLEVGRAGSLHNCPLQKSAHHGTADTLPTPVRSDINRRDTRPLTFNADAPDAHWLVSRKEGDEADDLGPGQNRDVRFGVIAVEVMHEREPGRVGTRQHNLMQVGAFGKLCQGRLEGGGLHQRDMQL